MLVLVEDYECHRGYNYDVREDGGENSHEEHGIGFFNETMTAVKSAFPSAYSYLVGIQVKDDVDGNKNN